MNHQHINYVIFKQMNHQVHSVQYPLKSRDCFAEGEIVEQNYSVKKENG